MNRIKSAGAVFAWFVLGWLIFFLPIARYIQTNFGLDIGYLPMTLVVLSLAAISLFAWWVFGNDRLATWLRIALGYLILLVGTLIVRRALGVWLFRRFVVLWIFAVIATILYAIVLIIIRLSQKKQEKDFNKALDHVRDKDR